RRPSRVRLNVLGPGRCFGEYGVIDDQASSASAQAVTAARLSVLPSAEFHRIVDLHDRIGRSGYANLLRLFLGRPPSQGPGRDAGGGPLGRGAPAGLPGPPSFRSPRPDAGVGVSPPALEHAADGGGIEVQGSREQRCRRLEELDVHARIPEPRELRVAANLM